MANREDVLKMMEKYIDIIEPNMSTAEGYPNGMSGFLINVGENEKRQMESSDGSIVELSGFNITVDWGMGWFVTEDTVITEKKPPLGEVMFIG